MRRPILSWAAQTLDRRVGDVNIRAATGQHAAPSPPPFSKKELALAGLEIPVQRQRPASLPAAADDPGVGALPMPEWTQTRPKPAPRVQLRAAAPANARPGATATVAAVADPGRRLRWFARLLGLFSVAALGAAVFVVLWFWRDLSALLYIG